MSPLLKLPWAFALVLFAFLLWSSPAAAFGAGNIASIAKIEGKNWRHGDIEDTLKTIVALKGMKWTSANIRKVYFGNWLRDYSQALDVGTLKSVPASTIRVLIWLLSFLSFGYATGDYEVTAERLGTYRPEEHIDNPKDYADNLDARIYDARLRPPINQQELAVDPNTCMKNYIANEFGGWATSSGYVKHSLKRSIHFGRLYTSGAGGVSGSSSDLAEAMRCLGQALHTLEDFSAHSNYVELVLKELGFTAVFTHTGSSTAVFNPRVGRPIFPLVTGTFGAVDFLHSVLGEAQDKFAATEINEMDNALGQAANESKQQKKSGKGGECDILVNLLSQIPGAGSFGSEASKLQQDSDAQEFSNMHIGGQRGYDDYSSSRAAPGPGGAPGSAAVQQQPGSFDPEKLAKQIYPILLFRDNVVHFIESIIEKIPGLTALVERISETLSIFILSLLAPYIQPVIKQVSEQLKSGSSEVVDSSAAHQFEPWTDPYCTDPTHSLLSKDHFSNKLNTPAGEVASAVVAYMVPRVIYAWENPTMDENVVMRDAEVILHHPALRDPNCEIHTTMFETVRRWVDRLSQSDRNSLNHILSPEGVRQGLNHEGGVFAGGHGGGHGKTSGGEWEKEEKKRKKKEEKDKKSYEDSGSYPQAGPPPGAYPSQGGYPPAGGYNAPPHAPSYAGMGYGAAPGFDAPGGFGDPYNHPPGPGYASGGYSGSDHKKDKKDKDKHKDKDKDKDKYDYERKDKKDKKDKRDKKDGYDSEDSYKKDKKDKKKDKKDKYKSDSEDEKKKKKHGGHGGGGGGGYPEYGQHGYGGGDPYRHHHHGNPPDQYPYDRNASFGPSIYQQGDAHDSQGYPPPSSHHHQHRITDDEYSRPASSDYDYRPSSSHEYAPQVAPPAGYADYQAQYYPSSEDPHHHHHHHHHHE